MMNKPQSKWSVPVRTLVVAAAMVSGAVPLIAQSQDSAMDIYRQDRADCMAGRTQQSRADCLYEARSALRDRQNGDPELTDAVASPAGPSGDNLSASNASRGAMSTDTTMADSGSYGSELAPRADRN